MTIVSTRERQEVDPLRYVYNEFIRAADLSDVAAVHHWMLNNPREKCVHRWDTGTERFQTSDASFTAQNDLTDYRDLDSFHLGIVPRRSEVDALQHAAGAPTKNYVLQTVVEASGAGWAVQNALRQFDPGADNNTAVSPITSQLCAGDSKAYFYDLISVYEPVVIQALPFLRSTGGVVTLNSISLSLAEILPSGALGSARIAGGNLGLGCINEGANIDVWIGTLDGFATTGTPPTYSGNVGTAGLLPVATFDGSQVLRARPTLPNETSFIASCCVRVDNSGGGATGVVLEVESGGTIGIRIRLVAGNIQALFENTLAVPHNISVAYPNDFQFHDITLHYDGTTLRLFVDGAQVGSVGAVGVAQAPGLVNVYLGDNSLSTDGLTGDIYAPELISPAITPAVLWLVGRGSVTGVSDYPITDC